MSFPTKSRGEAISLNVVTVTGAAQTLVQLGHPPLPDNMQFIQLTNSGGADLYVGLNGATANSYLLPSFFGPFGGGVKIPCMKASANKLYLYCATSTTCSVLCGGE
jgi:hypothetical protein